MAHAARRHQPPITIRSERALARLRLLTSGGRSQAEVIEEALEAMPLPARARSTVEKLARLNAILASVPPAGHNNTMAEFDAETYDGNGLPR